MNTSRLAPHQTHSSRKRMTRRLYTMIYRIDRTIRYGRQGENGVQSLPEHDDQDSSVYAHGLDQAMAWARTHKAFANTEPYDLTGGNYSFETPWEPHPNPYPGLLEWPEEVTHSCMIIILHPLDTVFESVPAPRADAKYY